MYNALLLERERPINDIETLRFSGSYNIFAFPDTTEIENSRLICLFAITGYENWANDVKLMLGFKPPVYWRITWMGVAPLAILVRSSNSKPIILVLKRGMETLL